MRMSTQLALISFMLHLRSLVYQ